MTVLSTAIAAVAAMVAITLFRGRRDRTSYEDINPCGEVTRVVVLVHGTWPRGLLKLADDVEWYRTDSALCGALVATPGTLVSRFPWSGSNTISSRADAAHALRAKLYGLQIANPSARHFLISHSHGASVVLVALQDIASARKVAGVVFLSAPFLRVSPRPWIEVQLEENYNPLQILVGLAVLGFLCGVLYLALQLQWLRIHDWVMNGLLCIIVTWGVVTAFRPSFLTQPLRFLYQRAVSYAATLEYPLLERKQVLIVRAVADEASAALVVSQFFAWTVSFVDHIVGRLLFPIVMVSIPLKALEVLPIPWRLPITSDSLIVLAVPLLLVALLLSFIGRTFAALPFGLRLSLVTPFLDFSVESAPPGIWMFRQMPPREFRGLFHSSPYQDPAVAAEVNQWLATF